MFFSNHNYNSYVAGVLKGKIFFNLKQLGKYYYTLMELDTYFLKGRIRIGFLKYQSQLGKPQKKLFPTPSSLVVTFFLLLSNTYFRPCVPPHWTGEHPVRVEGGPSHRG